MPSVSQSGQIAFTSSGVSTLTRDADRARDAGVIHVLVPAVPGAGEADVGDLAEADVLAGLGLERLVEGDRVFVDLADRVGEVEERQEPGGMPGRARGQLLPLDEHDIRPALLGEMIERRDADHAAADHHHAGVGSHAAAPLRRARLSSPRKRGPSTTAATNWRRHRQPSSASASFTGSPPSRG